MKKMRKSFMTAGALALACCAGFTACTSEVEPIKLEYYDYYQSTSYNEDLFYVNELDVTGADPSVIYIEEGEDAGYYYMYITSDDLGGSGFLAYKSKDMVDWTCEGVAYNPMSVYDASTGYTTISFGFTLYWAPEVVYDKESKLYYMFYTAQEYVSMLKNETYYYADIAVSTDPAGPFVQYNKYFEESLNYTPKEYAEEKLYVYEPVFDFAQMATDDPLYETEYNGYMKVIDMSPFVDPVSGNKYMYFCHDLGKTNASAQSSIYALALDDNWLPLKDENNHYKEVKKLTATNCYTVGGNAVSTLNEGAVNEAPFCVYNAESKKYYLLFSANSYMQKTYQVRVAVADNPMGPFTKLSQEEGGYLVQAEGHWSWSSGTGHCSVVNKDGQDYIFYHAHKDRVNGNSSRAVAFDELNWTENGNGMLVPVVNGPSYAVLPKTTGEYKNLARSATVSVENLADGSSAKYLNDGIIKNHDVAFIGESEFNKGTTKITLDLGDYKDVVAVSVFNSYNYDKAFGKIARITFEFYDEESGGYGKAYAEDLKFDWDRYYTEDGYIIPGGSFTIEFAQMKVKTVTVEFSNSSNVSAISEIVVLGK